MRKLGTVLMLIPFLLFCALDVGAVEKEERKWQDESIYYIMVDRFMNANRDNDYEVDTDDPDAYHGGDLQGIIEQLDYINEMGFTTIELSPIMSNQEMGYHGNWVDDFMAVEEHYGTIDDAKQLVEEAHDRDIKVIFDFNVNFTGDKHPWLEEDEKTDWFNDIDENQEPVEELNIDNPEVQQYLFDVAEFWIDETGVNGFRLEPGKNVSQEFWSGFNDHVKSIDKDFFVLGDVENEDPTSVADYESTGIDSFVNYSFHESLMNAFKSVDGSLGPLYDVWEQNEQLYENPMALGNFIDNQDQQRFTRTAVEHGGNPITRWKLALTHMFTSPGIPMMYYGTEIPLDGGQAPENRRMMDFKGGDEELNQRIEKLTSMRDEFPALTRGSYQELYNEDGLAVFKREYEEQTMVIAINNASATRTADISDLPDNQQMRGLLEDGVVRQSDDGVYKLGMERELADVFVVEDDQGYNWLFIGFVGGVLFLFVTAITWMSIKSKRASNLKGDK
ncbi:alpha-amylase family glycosyl hydrolase [Halobacillus seohaensis]|uniref:alpha-amylase n=1 Tax=Halobacillus seohaensis TaxID=447421 RepID=A0ABW2EMS4_9BACI